MGNTCDGRCGGAGASSVGTADFQPPEQWTATALGASDVGAPASAAPLPRVDDVAKVPSRQQEGPPPPQEQAAPPSAAKAPAPAKTLRMTKELGDEALLRGMNAFYAMRGFSSIFESSAGDDGTYELSRQVPRIRWFISHNWSVSRWQKFGVLCLHFNMLAAAVITFLAMVLFASLTALGLLPTIKVQEDPYNNTETMTEVGVVSQLAATLVFLFVLFTWHEVGGRVGLLRDPCFLDKSCICQTDEKLKAAGINSLAGFLTNTDGMLVCYTDIYLFKMWTCYELASVLLLAPKVRIRVIPVYMPKLVLIGALMYYLVNITEVLSLWEETQDKFGSTGRTLTAVIQLIPAMAFFYFVRGMARVEDRIKDAVDDFRIQEAKCYDENDREKVCNTVVNFMRGKGIVPQEAEKPEVLRAFDTLVRRRVPAVLLKSFSAGGVPYWLVLALLLPTAAHHFDWIGAAIHRGEGAAEIAEVTLFKLCIYFLLLPTWVKVASWTLSQGLPIHGCLELACVGVGGLVAIVAVIISWWALDSLRRWAMDPEIDTTGLVVYVVTILVLIFTTGHLYNARAHLISNLVRLLL